MACYNSDARMSGLFSRIKKRREERKKKYGTKSVIGSIFKRASDRRDERQEETGRKSFFGSKFAQWGARIRSKKELRQMRENAEKQAITELTATPSAEVIKAEAAAADSDPANYVVPVVGGVAALLLIKALKGRK
jgi:hypothetical protein